jgi:hypothetical protein
MTESASSSSSSVPQPRPLTNEEAEGVRLFMRQQEGQRAREAISRDRIVRAREAMDQHSRPRAALPPGWASGFKTSEFWTAVAGVGLAVAKGYGYNIPEDAFWGIVAYILGRSGMKSAAAYRSGVKQ